MILELDFTGVPAVVDLASMRDVMKNLGSDPDTINPLTDNQVPMTTKSGPWKKAASTKGKASKLHKRKHQIGSLLYDLRHKEMELAERRAKGFLTKTQTQAKYGW